MKEIPILFSTPMVQALLDGRKTMTRRIVNTKRSGWDCQTMKFALSKIIRAIDTKISSVIGFHAFFQANDSDHKLGTMCHYGQPGDVLWVRESFSFWLDAIKYKADGESVLKGFKYKPSIHMRKDYARIWLQVEEIRVEQLQDISEEDAKSEGILPAIESSSSFLYYDKYSMKLLAGGAMKTEVIKGEKVRIGASYTGAKSSFRSLWTYINGPQSWDSNPWVWVVKFKTLSTTGKPQMCYKTNELCKYDCIGLCRESM